MKQLLILSGKGGTGKTTVASAFIKLSKAKDYADCDVDAPNLHLAIQHLQKPKHTKFYGMMKANIDSTLCTNCGLCKTHCRFDAITSAYAGIILMFSSIKLMNMPVRGVVFARWYVQKMRYLCKSMLLVILFYIKATRYSRRLY